MAETTAFTFATFGHKPADATYQGDACSNGVLLSLTSGVQQSVGRILYSKPVQFWQPEEQAIFETTITFKINPRDSPGDGIAFFIAPVNTEIPRGASGGNLGIFRTDGTASNLFAVEFDTFPNANWDPDYTHIGININNRKSVYYEKFVNFLGKEVTATITYRKGIVTVAAFVDGVFTPFRYHVDLKSILTPQVQVGISASTGDNVQENYIRHWSFTSALVRDA